MSRVTYSQSVMRRNELNAWRKLARKAHDEPGGLALFGCTVFVFAFVAMLAVFA